MEYKSITEVKELSLSDFISYCELINADISSCVDGELCRSKDDYLPLKNIEDKYILMSLRNIANDSYDSYTIYDKDGKRIPFSFVSVLGCIFKELLEKVILYYKYKDSVILREY